MFICGMARRHFGLAKDASPYASYLCTHNLMYFVFVCYMEKHERVANILYYLLLTCRDSRKLIAFAETTGNMYKHTHTHAPHIHEKSEHSGLRKIRPKFSLLYTYYIYTYLLFIYTLIVRIYVLLLSFSRGK